MLMVVVALLNGGRGDRGRYRMWDRVFMSDFCQKA